MDMDLLYFAASEEELMSALCQAPTQLVHMCDLLPSSQVLEIGSTVLSLSLISRKLKFKKIKLYLQSNRSAKCQKLAWELDLLDTRDCVPIHYSMLLQEILSDPLPPMHVSLLPSLLHPSNYGPSCPFKKNLKSKEILVFLM